MTATESRLLLAACRERPECDTTRLVLADALEEEGQFPLAAAYIRESIRFAREGSATRRPGLDYLKWLASVLGAEHNHGAAGWVPEYLCAGEGWDEFIWRAPGERRMCLFEIRRGLPEAVRLSCPLLMERAAVLNIFPLTRVAVTDRKPVRDDVLHFWACRPYPAKFNTWEDDEHAIPAPLFNLLPVGHRWKGRYHRRADALGALNEAARLFVAQGGVGTPP